MYTKTGLDFVVMRKEIMNAEKTKRNNNFVRKLSFLFWLGWQDSNLRMQQSKCCVLPLDDTPIWI